MKLKTFFDFCSGIGGGRLGLERAGLKCVGSSDTSRLANTTYKLLFPKSKDKNWGNLKRLINKDLPTFDLLIAGFPCQTFSVIGRQKGTLDKRGQLIYFLIEIIIKNKPKVIILENVKGLITHDKGKTFSDILKKIEDAGYTTIFKVLNSMDFGIPHMRQRVYIIGFRNNLDLDLNKFKWPQPIPRKHIKNFLIPKTNLMTHNDFDWFVNNYLHNEKNNNKFQLDKILKKNYQILDTRMSDLRIYSNRMPTLRAQRDGIYYTYKGQLYFLTGEEALLFQGFSKWHIKKVTTLVTNRHLLMQAGNAMTASVVRGLANSILELFNEV